MKKMCLCRYCIEEMVSRGEKIRGIRTLFDGSPYLYMDEAEEQGIACEWCDEFDDLYECVIK